MHQTYHTSNIDGQTDISSSIVSIYFYGVYRVLALSANRVRCFRRVESIMINGKYMVGNVEE